MVSFWETITKKTLYDLGTQMEGYCISGVECKYFGPSFFSPPVLIADTLSDSDRQELRPGNP